MPFFKSMIIPLESNYFTICSAVNIHNLNKKIMRNRECEIKKPVLTKTLCMAGVILLINLTGCNDTKKDAEDVDQTENTSDAIGVKENNEKVIAYVRFVEEDNTKMELDHSYTNEALLKLTEATRAIAEETNHDVRGDLDKVKEYADKITTDPFATTHADNIRKSADILTSVLQNIQQARYPGLSKEVEEVKNACAAIKPNVLTLDQKEAVKSFFRESADVLEKMN